MNTRRFVLKPITMIPLINDGAVRRLAGILGLAFTMLPAAAAVGAVVEAGVLPSPSLTSRFLLAVPLLEIWLLPETICQTKKATSGLSLSRFPLQPPAWPSN